MLFHMSIAADDPKHVATVIAELWNGEVRPFPPISDNGWIALARDDRGTVLEVYPLGTVLRETDGDADAHGEAGGSDRFTPTHGAIATQLERDEVLAIAAREGWPAKYRKRGGNVRGGRAVDRRPANDGGSHPLNAGRVCRSHESPATVL